METAVQENLGLTPREVKRLFRADLLSSTPTLDEVEAMRRVSRLEQRSAFLAARLLPRLSPDQRRRVSELALQYLGRRAWQDPSLAKAFRLPPAEVKRVADMLNRWKPEAIDKRSLGPVPKSDAPKEIKVAYWQRWKVEEEAFWRRVQSNERLLIYDALDRLPEDSRRRALAAYGAPILPRGIYPRASVRARAVDFCRDPKMLRAAGAPESVARRAERVVALQQEHKIYQQPQLTLLAETRFLQLSDVVQARLLEFARNDLGSRAIFMPEVLAAIEIDLDQLVVQHRRLLRQHVRSSTGTLVTQRS